MRLYLLCRFSLCRINCAPVFGSVPKRSTVTAKNPIQKGMENLNVPKWIYIFHSCIQQSACLTSQTDSYGLCRYLGKLLGVGKLFFFWSWKANKLLPGNPPHTLSVAEQFQSILLSEIEVSYFGKQVLVKWLNQILVKSWISGNFKGWQVETAPLMVSWLFISCRDHVFAINLASSSEQIIPQQVRKSTCSVDWVSSQSNI